MSLKSILAVILVKQFFFHKEVITYMKDEVLKDILL